MSSNNQAEQTPDSTFQKKDEINRSLKNGSFHHGHHNKNQVDHETVFLPLTCPIGCFKGNFLKEGLSPDWIEHTDDFDLTPELVKLKKIWKKIVKKGKSVIGDECLVFQMLLVNDVTHMEQMEIKNTATKASILKTKTSILFGGSKIKSMAL